MTRIRCGNRENDKYLDGVRDLIASQKARAFLHSARSVGEISEVRLSRSSRKSHRLRKCSPINANLSCSLSLFNMVGFVKEQ